MRHLSSFCLPAVRRMLYLTHQAYSETALLTLPLAVITVMISFHLPIKDRAKIYLNAVAWHDRINMDYC